MKSSDQADSGGDWRVQLQDMRTISALRAGSPHPDEVERLSDRALRAASLNPDHSEEARAAAAEALRARRLSAEPWRVQVPSFLGARDLERSDALFFGWPRKLRGGLALVAPLALAAGVVFAFGPWAVSAALFGVGFAALVLWVGWLALRLKPARVCVVRPALRAARAPLRSAVAGELRPYGHVVSLASGVEGLVVKSAADYRARALELGNRLALNLANMGTRRETLALSASDAWRPLVLNLLLDSSDAIVVDLSDGGSWALAAIQAEGAVRRCVFVALWGRLEEAQAALRDAGLSPRVFPYAPDGEMQRRPLFRAAMLEAMRATHAADA
ncbi:MAG: hypothetical protein M0D54_15560 [Hyphomonadaceae bacterium JAD_PAG50586_4]|nr:MAG: hypothetical protein M0D54_15560 [Hyphomonadaceae bacterium JAD_PAG50586_4]